MSTIGASCADRLFHSVLPLHPLCRMKPGVPPVGFRRGPVRSHPGGPAQLSEPAKTHGLDRARGNGELGIPLELGSVVEIDEVSERLAEVSAWQEPDVLLKRPRIDANPD